MVLTGAMLLGTVISSRLKRRAEVLEEIVAFITAVGLEIEFMSLPVYEILRKMAEFDGCKHLDFVSICLEKMEKGEDFKNSWAFGVVSSLLPLRQDEREKLKRLGFVIGTSDAEGQRAMLSLYGSYFSAFSNKARQDYEKYGKTSITLSTVAGMGAFILII